MGRRHAHLPSVGAVLTLPETHPYLVVKQDNNSTTFVVSDIEIPGLTGVIEHTARAIRRPITGTTDAPTPAMRQTGAGGYLGVLTRLFLCMTSSAHEHAGSAVR